jgi:hypothetical protein
MQDRADQLSVESDAVNTQLSLISRLSNLSLQLYSWYIKHGHARNKEGRRRIERIFSRLIYLKKQKKHGLL